MASRCGNATGTAAAGADPGEGAEGAEGAATVTLAVGAAGTCAMPGPAFLTSGAVQPTIVTVNVTVIVTVRASIATLRLMAGRGGNEAGNVSLLPQKTRRLQTVM